MENMIWIDYAFMVIIAVSAVLGVFRGLVKEAISLISWVLAIWISIHFSPMLAQLMIDLIPSDTIRGIGAFVILFIGTLIVGSIISFVIRSGLNKIGLGFLDRLGGVLFGVGRGCGIILIIIYITAMTPIKRESWWTRSVFIPPFEELSLWLRAQAPSDVVRQIENTVTKH